ncbi:MAG: ankyrin repeat domain-containing protein [Alphaproteobacteria bacterium]|nr:ankyrin repeat domain-containing protein [Alphaproteobacteria bacterium]OJV13467.1 MAG: hypothetical protein BGO27_04570 [Alphaproteobacteria bacterium 33-17]
MVEQPLTKLLKLLNTIQNYKNNNNTENHMAKDSNNVPVELIKEYIDLAGKTTNLTLLNAKANELIEKLKELSNKFSEEQIKSILSSIDSSGLTILHYAVYTNFDLVKTLVEGGVDVNNVASISKATPLMAAAKASKNNPVPYLEIAKYLISKGADLELLDKDKNSALFLAVKSDNVEIAKLLIDNKAQTDRNLYPSLFSIALSKKHNELLPLLVNEKVFKFALNDYMKKSSDNVVLEIIKHIDKTQEFYNKVIVNQFKSVCETVNYVADLDFLYNSLNVDENKAMFIFENLKAESLNDTFIKYLIEKHIEENNNLNSILDITNIEFNKTITCHRIATIIKQKISVLSTEFVEKITNEQIKLHLKALIKNDIVHNDNSTTVPTPVPPVDLSKTSPDKSVTPSSTTTSGNSVTTTGAALRGVTPPSGSTTTVTTPASPITTATPATPAAPAPAATGSSGTTPPQVPKPQAPVQLSKEAVMKHMNSKFKASFSLTNIVKVGFTLARRVGIGALIFKGIKNLMPRPLAIGISAVASIVFNYFALEKGNYSPTSKLGKFICEYVLGGRNSAEDQKVVEPYVATIPLDVKSEARTHIYQTSLLDMAVGTRNTRQYKGL